MDFDTLKRDYFMYVVEEIGVKKPVLYHTNKLDEADFDKLKYREMFAETIPQFRHASSTEFQINKEARIQRDWR